MENGHQHCKVFSMLFVVNGINMQKQWYGPLTIYDSVSGIGLLDVQSSSVLIIPIQIFQNATNKAETSVNSYSF